jgi:hypothetical protein
MLEFETCVEHLDNFIFTCEDATYGKFYDIFHVCFDQVSSPIDIDECEHCHKKVPKKILKRRNVMNSLS